MATYGYYHDFSHEVPRKHSSRKRKFIIGVEVLLCHDGYKYRANEVATQGAPELVALRDCPMRRDKSGAPKPMIRTLEREIREVLDNREPGY